MTRTEKAERNMEILRLRAAGETHPAIGKRFGLTADMVGRIVRAAKLASSGDEDDPDDRQTPPTR